MVAPAIQPLQAAHHTGRFEVLRSTPGLLRGIAVISVVTIVVVGAFVWLLTTNLVNRTGEIAETTGVVLITNQQIKASLAEADAAAAAVHLAGADGDRLQQRSYQTSLSRATNGIEVVASSLGDDATGHATLQSVSADITVYAATVEGARTAAVGELDDANERLGEAIVLLRDDIGTDIDSLTNAAEASFDEDVDANWFYAAIIAVVVLILVVVALQLWLYRRFRRILNVPILVATAVLIALLIWVNYSFGRQQSALNDARDGAYEAIGLTEDIQRDAFAYRADETAAMFDTASRDDEALQARRERVSNTIGRARTEADSERERAAIEEVSIRWERYVETSRRLRLAIDANDQSAAQALIRGDSTTAFAGFNTSVEGALYDNQTQFALSVDDAVAALKYLRWIIAFSMLGAAGMVWWGLDQRIAEYR